MEEEINDYYEIEESINEQIEYQNELSEFEAQSVSQKSKVDNKKRNKSIDYRIEMSLEDEQSDDSKDEDFGQIKKSKKQSKKQNKSSQKKSKQIKAQEQEIILSDEIMIWKNKQDHYMQELKILVNQNLHTYKCEIDQDQQRKIIPELESNIQNGMSLDDPLSKILAPIIDLKPAHDMSEMVKLCSQQIQNFSQCLVHKDSNYWVDQILKIANRTDLLKNVTKQLQNYQIDCHGYYLWELKNLDCLSLYADMVEVHHSKKQRQHHVKMIELLVKVVKNIQKAKSDENIKDINAAVDAFEKQKQNEPKMKDKSVKKNSKRVVKDVEIPISNIFKGLKDVSSQEQSLSQQQKVNSDNIEFVQQSQKTKSEKKLDEELKKREKKLEEEQRKILKKQEEDKKKEEKKLDEEKRKEEKRLFEELKKEEKRIEDEKKANKQKSILSFFGKTQKPNQYGCTTMNDIDSKKEKFKAVTENQNLRQIHFDDEKHEIFLKSINSVQVNTLKQALGNIKNPFSQFQKRTKRIVFFYFYDSIKQCRISVFDKTSKVITGKTPFAKDDNIDYDFDSDEEAEMNAAEDLDKSDKELDEEDEEDSDDQNGWMVPDGHLSDDEVGSQKSDNQLIIMNEQGFIQNKGQFIFSFQNYQMGSDKSMDEFVKNFTIFQISDKSFPIQLKKVEKEKISNEDQNSLKNNAEIQKDLVALLHGSHETKQFICNELMKKHTNVKNNTVKQFVKKIIVSWKTSKEPWMVDQQYMQSLNIDGELIFNQNKLINDQKQLQLLELCKEKKILSKQKKLEQKSPQESIQKLFQKQVQLTDFGSQIDQKIITNQNDDISMIKFDITELKKYSQHTDNIQQNQQIQQEIFIPNSNN